ncbi:MAG TPA: hypothetical protein VFT39_03480 [Vicinamibacterales bacterium]|nr:hypothetical protein [Vicinamibacterales bacterium]
MFAHGWRLRRLTMIALTVLMAVAWAASRPVGAKAPMNPSLYSGLKWRMLGPFRGGRVDAVSGVRGRPHEFYFGAVNGGVWKTIDAGRIWTPIFDSQPVASIGALAVSDSEPNTIYVGTGESTLRDSVGYGSGMYKSVDAGKTWTHIGLENTQHIGRVAIDPKNANVVFVAAIGHLYQAHSDRGIFRTRDGGKTWQKVLFRNNDVGAVDVVIDPANSQVIYASLWNTRRPPWYTYQPSNGPGGGIFKSTDGGATWKQLAGGLPTACVGRAGIAVAPTNPRRVYAVVDNFLPEGAPADAKCPGTPLGRGGGAGAGAAVDAGRGGAGAPAVQLQGGFYRSDDAGATWTKLSGDTALWGRGWYFEHVTSDPRNADIVYVSNVSLSRSKDGGKTWEPLRGSPGGDDYQGTWVSPDDSDTMIVASDQGTIITHNATAEDPRDVTWSSWLNQPTAQIYHLSVDYRTPYWVTGAQQDSGAVAVRSRGKFAVITMRDWEPIGPGGESGMTAGDPAHPGMVYGGLGTRYDLEQNVPLPTAVPTSPEPARTDWTQPLVFSKADRRALYYANQFLFRTTDGAQTWTQISPDLTRPDPGVPASLDPVSAEDTDRNGKRGVIYGVGPSPLNAHMIWVGTDDGLIHLSIDDGKSWQNVTPPAIDAWSRITGIEGSHTQEDTAYAAVDRHQLSDFGPHIYRTRDRGKTWQEISRGLPPNGYVHVVKEDPVRRGLLFAGTERGAFVSFDDGDNWQSLQLNLPVTSVRDFEVYQNDLIVATHGRGFWVIDDISPLRQASDEIASREAYLFKPADAVVFSQASDNGTPTQKDEPQAQNAPNGATIDYYLKSAVTGPVSIEILDARGACLAMFTNAPQPDSTCAAGGAGRGARGAGARGGGGIPNTSILWRPTPESFSTAAGMHRVVWSPGGGGRGFGGRGAATPVPTGAFTARLTVNGQTQTQTFALKADPRIANR